MSVHANETRLSASELKFAVEPPVAAGIRQWARERLEADSHGTGAFLDEYSTSSLYFDTAAHDVLWRRESFGRAKFRIRRYGQNDLVFLERKLRTPRLLVKRRTLTPLSELETLMKAEMDPGWPAYWFHRRLAIRRLAPVCQLNYARTARTHMTPRGLARLTIDDELSVAPADTMRFNAHVPLPIGNGKQVVELKFPGEVPAVFKELIAEFHLEPQTLSKYRLGMGALGYVAGPAADAVPPGNIRQSA